MVTNLLFHLVAHDWHGLRLLHWRTTLRHGIEATHWWESSVGLRHNWLLTSWTLSVRELATLSGWIVEFAATTTLVSASSLLLASLIHLGVIENMFKFTHLTLVSLLFSFLWRLPELNTQETGSKNVGLIKFLDCFFG